MPKAYRDPTADKAIHKADTDRKNHKQADELLTIYDRIAHFAKFKIIHIRLKSTQTGNEYERTERTTKKNKIN